MADDFESTFANISYSFLEQKSPRLMQYLVGFKLIDKNDSQSKGIGIYTFNIGGHDIFAPAFFINGQCKPMDMLYIKDTDKFVSFDENWVDHLIKQKPFELGKVSTPEQDKYNPTIDMRSYVLPPRTGRFVTAEWKGGRLPDFISELPTNGKKVFASWLR